MGHPSHNTTHFIGVFASFACDNPNGYETVLLCFSPKINERSFTAQDHKEFIEFTLSLYDKNLNNVVAIIGDNAEVNRATSRLCKIPIIGCSSHKLHLAITQYLCRYQDLLDKVNGIMCKLRSFKLSGKLRTQTNLRPVQRNKTRWLSTFEMIDRYLRLKPFLGIFQDDLDF